MLIGASLLILLVIIIFNLVLGGDFIQAVSSVAIDNTAIVDGVPTTYVVNPEAVYVGIELGQLVGAIGIVSAIFIVAAAVTGITVVGTGLNAQSAKFIILASAYVSIWLLLSILAYGLIVSIQVYGAIIYVMISIAYVIGVAQSLAGGSD